ncbi:hypothetical protein YPPY58_1611, partial [Yersinia pestis PY-58]
MVPWFITLVL